MQLIMLVVSLAMQAPVVGSQPTISGIISTIAGPSIPTNGARADTQFIGEPLAIVADIAGGYYMTNGNDVYHIDQNGLMTIIVGNGTSGEPADDGIDAISAHFKLAYGLALDSGGNLFVADQFDFRVRKIKPDGTISTVAGDGTKTTGFRNGIPATTAHIQPVDVAVDRDGNLYVADTTRIYKVDSQGIMTSIAGQDVPGFEGDGGPATSALLYGPRGMAFDSLGNFYFSEYGAWRIRKIDKAGIISTIAGAGTGPGPIRDGGPATSAIVGALSLAFDAEDNLFISDYENNRIRKIDTKGMITTVAGNGSVGFSGDGREGINAQLGLPMSIAIASNGLLLIADTANYRVRRLGGGGIIFTIAGIDMPDRNVVSGIGSPRGLAVDSDGNTYIGDSDRILKLGPDGIITKIAGNGQWNTTTDSGPAASSAVRPIAMHFDPNGNLIFTEDLQVRRISTNGLVTTIAGDNSYGVSGDGIRAVDAKITGAWGITLDSAGNIFFAEPPLGRIRKISVAGLITTIAGGGTDGTSEGIAANAAKIFPDDVAVDAAGNVFFSERQNNRVRKISGGVVRTVAGTGHAGFSGDNGSATAADLYHPLYLTVDAAGNLYISDQGNNRIRKVSTDGIITTIAGNGAPAFRGDGGPAIQASLSEPGTITVDAKGNLIFADQRNNRVRRIEFSQSEGFSILAGGTLSLETSGSSTSGSSGNGYASIESDGFGNAVGALAIIRLRKNGVLISETSVPTSPLISAGRIFAEINGLIDTGLVITNPNSKPVKVSFYFTDASGDFNTGETTIAAREQIAKFLDQLPFKGRSPVIGTFTFTSSLPVAATALRGRTNERGDFLMTTLPVIDLSNLTSSTVSFPHFADGDGWTSQIVLVNPVDTLISGHINMLDASGSAVLVDAGGEAASTFTYSIAPKSAFVLHTSGNSAGVLNGSIRIIPSDAQVSPSGVVIFSFRREATTVTEAGVAALPAAQDFILYAENSGSGGNPGPILIGVAMINSSPNTAIVDLMLRNLDGSLLSRKATIEIPSNGKFVKFVSEIEELGLTKPFEGVLNISSSAPVSVIGLRGRYNERSDFLITTIPPVLTDRPSTSPLFLPFIVDSEGYATQIVVFASATEAVAGTLRLFSQSGAPLNTRLTAH